MRIIQVFNEYKNEKTGVIMNYLYYGWMGFPIVFLLSPETFGLIPSYPIILSLYLVLDIITKIIFYFSIKKINKKNEL
jgi:bacteriorhodopsin